MPYSDKKKQQEFQRDFVRKKKETNPGWHAELKRHNEHKRQVSQDIVNHIKKTFGCLLCGEKNPDGLFFHHVLPEFKLATISDLISNRAKVVTILHEIDKCVCVCTPCHKQLDSTTLYLKENIKKEKWHKDWGLSQALEWSSFHPQNRLDKNNFIEVIKAVVRNCQIYDSKKFNST